MVQLVVTMPHTPPTVPVTRLCQALALSRATYCRWRAAAPVSDPDVERRAQVQAIAVEMPAYG